jgi:hypothetical protein
VSRATAQAAAFLLATLGAAGCFDVRTVDPGPLLIDDFEDGDLTPADAIFEPWGCFSFSPPSNRIDKCDHDAGYDSAFSLELEATIDDPPDGKEQHGGAGVGIKTKVPQDLTPFRSIVFNAWFASGDPPISSNAVLHLELRCGSARTLEGTLPNDLYVAQDIIYQNHWKPFDLPLNSFGSPTTAILGGLDACLRSIDSIRFTFDAQLPDGKSGKAILHVDDIELR